MADAVVVPGRMFGPLGGVLAYTGLVAERRGATVHRHSWSNEPPKPDDPAVEKWVLRDVTPLFDEVGGHPLVIAKSLGTNTAALAAERSLPAVWLTPVLTLPWIVASLGRATAPFLLVGGTGDEMWDGGVARRLTPHVLEVDDADHGLAVPGPASDTIGVLGRIVAAMEEFLDRIGWPD